MRRMTFRTTTSARSTFRSQISMTHSMLHRCEEPQTSLLTPHHVSMLNFPPRQCQRVRHHPSSQHLPCRRHSSSSSKPWEEGSSQTPTLCSKPQRLGTTEGIREAIQHAPSGKDQGRIRKAYSSSMVSPKSTGHGAAVSGTIVLRIGHTGGTSLTTLRSYLSNSKQSSWSSSNFMVSTQRLSVQIFGAFFFAG